MNRFSRPPLSQPSRRLIIALSILLPLLGALAPAGSGSASGARWISVAKGSLETKSLVIAGAERSYLLYLPSRYEKSRTMPLVIVLHGSGVAAEGMLRIGLNEYADRAGFIVVYPQLSSEEPPVDVAFVSELLTALQAELPIDARRIYVTGISRGAGIVYLLACDDRVAAIAPVATAARYGFMCAGGRRVSILHIHGTADGQNPYAPVPDIIEYWRQQDGCGSSPDVAVDDSGAELVVRETYACEQGREVTLYTIEGGVHAWPGAPRGEDDLRLGANEEAPASMAISATPIIWEFFRAHPQPD